MITKIQTTLLTPDGKLSHFQAQNVNIFVGPNSSGKSLILNDIKKFLMPEDYYGSTEKCFILADIDFDPLSIEEQLDYINSYDNNLTIETYNSNNWNTITIKNNKIQVADIYYSLNSPEKSNSYFESPDAQKKKRCRYYENNRTLFLNGSTRLSLLDSSQFSPYSEAEEYNTVYSVLYHSEELYTIFREYILDAFSLYTYFKINGNNVEFVFSRVPAPANFDEYSLKKESTDFLKNCLTGNELSDGQRSYIGILLQLLAGDPETIIIDEAEAFLHPPLARKLGDLISKIANEKNKQVFLSTHSSNIIMGCIQSGAKTNIIRLAYDGENGYSTMIDSSKLKQMMTHPLIRSTNFLDGLFYKNAIVTESDSDRAFYQEINYRLLKFKPDYGIEDCLFLNAQNKQTVGTIVKELRNLGVPTVSILDLDFIKEGGSEFTNYLDSVNIPKELHSSIANSKSSLKKYFEELGNDNALKTTGIEALTDGKKDLADDFLDKLNKYGLFPVPIGELECWLPEVESYNHGSKWLIKKFESLGFDESDSNYIKPTEGDVWKFLKNTKEWLDNSDRKGMINLK